MLYEGAILDGRNRARACAELGIEPATREWRGEGGSPAVFVVSMNLQRRHLSPAERAIFAAQISPKSKGGNPKLLTAPNGAISQRQAARLAGVGEGTVQRAAARLAETQPPPTEEVLATRAAKPSPEKIGTNVPISQRQAARLVGATPRTVRRGAACLDRGFADTPARERTA